MNSFAFALIIASIVAGAVALAVYGHTCLAAFLLFVAFGGGVSFRETREDKPPTPPSLTKNLRQ